MNICALLLCAGATSLVWAGGQTRVHKGLRRRGTLSGSWPSKYTQLFKIWPVWSNEIFNLRQKPLHKKCKCKCVCVCVRSRPWVFTCTGSWWFRRTLSNRRWLVAASHWSKNKWTKRHAKWSRRWFYDVGGEVIFSPPKCCVTDTQWTERKQLSLFWTSCLFTDTKYE